MATIRGKSYLGYGSGALSLSRFNVDGRAAPSLLSVVHELIAIKRSLQARWNPLDAATKTHRMTWMNIRGETVVECIEFR